MGALTKEYNFGLESVATDTDYHSSSKIVRTCKIEFFHSILRTEICCHMKVLYIKVISRSYYQKFHILYVIQYEKKTQQLFTRD